MKRIINLLTIALLIAGFSAAANAQGEEKSGEAVSSYDKAKNETTFEVEGLDVGTPGGPRIILNASVSFAGQKLTKKPEQVIFIIQIGSAGGYKHPDIIEMKVTVDGKKKPDVLMLNLDKRMAGDMFLESMGTRMDYDVFKAIAGGKSVELRLNTTTITIGSAHLAKFADLDKMINQ